MFFAKYGKEQKKRKVSEESCLVFKEQVEGDLSGEDFHL